MKVLFNATTLVKGGALQVAVAFIRQSLVDDGGITWRFALSKQVAGELSEAELVKLGSRLTVLEASPAKSNGMRKQLDKLCLDFGADVVFTLFGPAYVNFGVLHICGVADGWVTHSNFLAFNALGTVYSMLRMFLVIIYKAFWYRKANAWIVEAGNAKQGLITRLRIKPELIHIVRNTCSQFYRNRLATLRFPDKSEKIRLVCLTAYYRGKNLEIIPEVARQLLEIDKNLDFEFVITLPTDDAGLNAILLKAELLGVSKYINNVGPVRVSEGPDLYASCHIVFLPSLLETFSANYPEAMAIGRPIVTTDLDFARDACKDAALYFQPLDAKSAAEKIMMLINDTVICKTIIDCGRRVLDELPTPEERFNQYISHIKSLYAEAK